MKTGDERRADQLFESLYQAEANRFLDFRTAIGQAILPALKTRDWSDGLACADCAEAELALDCSAGDAELLVAARSGALEVLAGVCGRFEDALACGREDLFGMERLVLRTTGARSLAWYYMFALEIFLCLDCAKNADSELLGEEPNQFGHASISGSRQHPTLSLFRDDNLRVGELEERMGNLLKEFPQLSRCSLDLWRFVADCFVVHAVSAGAVAIEGSCAEERLAFLGYIRRNASFFRKATELCCALCESSSTLGSSHKPPSLCDPLEESKALLDGVRNLLLSIMSMDVQGFREGVDLLRNYGRNYGDTIEWH